MTYDLVYTQRAKRDLQRATESIARCAPDTAQRWFEGFIATLARLTTEANVYSLAPEGVATGAEVRQLLYRSKSRRVNRALYTVRGSKVYILAVRRPGEDLLTDEELAQALDDLP